MKYIKLTRGKSAIVSDADFFSLNGFKWCAHFDGWNWYAKRRKPGPRSCNTTITMHQEILHCKHGQEVDHKNGNGLDNRRSNLRLSTHKQNVRNRAGSKSKGISKIGKMFRARISINGEKKHLGMFPTKRQAIAAYESSSIRYFGKFVRDIKYERRISEV